MGMAIASGQEGTGFDWQVTKRLLSYLNPYRRNVTLALIAAVVNAFAGAAGPPLIGWAIAEGIEKANMSLVGVGVALYLATQGVGLYAFRVQILQMASAGQRVIQKLRDDLFAHIQALSPSFFATYETGRLIARVIGDVNVLREAITFAVVGTFRDMLSLVAILVLMLRINAPLTLIALGTMAALIAVANWWRIHARRAYLRVRETNAVVNAELSEAFSGVRVVQAFDRQAHNTARFNYAINHANLQSNLGATMVAALFFPGIELIGGLATGLLITVGGLLVLDQGLSVFTLVTFLLYIDQFFFPIRMLAQRFNVFQAVMAAGDKLFGLLDAPIEVGDAPHAKPLPPIDGHIVFENVGFAYNDGEMVLHNVHLDVPPGTTVALVGHTGAGKSTIVRLLMRFHDVTSGAVRVDGHDVRDVSLESLRAQMGVVLQETHLFSGSIMDNIRYGRLDATDDEVVEAARAVGADVFISRLEQGYQTPVSEAGANLSQGQKQLLAFARALLADPRILILDEATSSIDTQTEKLIQNALSRVLDGRTSFVIAHRLSTIRAADLIVVMDHGHMVEAGTHEELIARRGAYYDLYTLV